MTLVPGHVEEEKWPCDFFVVVVFTKQLEAISTLLGLSE